MNDKGKYLFSQQADFKALEKPYISPEGKQFVFLFFFFFFLFFFSFFLLKKFE